MRAKWEGNDLHLRTAEKGWGIPVGWVEPVKRGSGFYVYCHWMSGDGDYPENTVFDTAKQARRALKAAATVALIGGLIKANNF